MFGFWGLVLWALPSCVAARSGELSAADILFTRRTDAAAQALEKQS